MSKANDDFDIIPATDEDRDRIAEFLRQYFYSHEPLNVAAKAPPNRPTEGMFSLTFLHQGMSLLAVSRKEGTILGVCINGKEHKGEEGPGRSQLTLTNDAYVKIKDFLNKLEHDVDVFNRTDCDRAIYVNVLAVHPEARGRGIGRALMEVTRNKAIAAGYPLLYVMCTSYFSAKIARAMGMHNIYSLPYSDYKNEDDTPVFSPPAPHSEVIAFAQKL